MLAELETLIHGNELIAQLTSEYPPPEDAPRFGNSGHTLPLVLDTIERSGAKPPMPADLPRGVETAVDVFVGFLLLDALIGNTDRHHENWAVIERVDFTEGELRFHLHLAPTYDHASCLGRNEPDARRAERLRSRDRGNTVEAYADRCDSALYMNAADRKPLRTIDAFRRASELRARAAEAWKERLRVVGPAEIKAVLAEVPQQRCSSVAQEFAVRIVLYNRVRLLGNED
jgi:hypothetical protein